MRSEGPRRAAVVASASVLVVHTFAGCRSPSAEHGPTPVAHAAEAEASPVVKVRPFPMDRVRLLPGPLASASSVNEAVLEGTTNDSVLFAFRKNAGLATPGRPLGGWAEPGSPFSGHYEGHFLSALALSYAQTGKRAYAERLDALALELERVQGALVPVTLGEPPGYLSAFPETRFDDLDAGRLAKVPWYTIHKIMAGLLDAHQHGASAAALRVVERMAEWAGWRSHRLADDAWQAALAREEFGGMAEVFANLYAVTHDGAHLALARRFQQPSLLGPLAAGTDNLAGHHANTYLAKIVGAGRLHELSEDREHADIVHNFFDFVRQTRTYPTGGNSLEEYFQKAHDLSKELFGSTHETCNVYNMMKLARKLFTWTGAATYADFTEQALVNGILGSMRPVDGSKTYYQYMGPDAVKVFNSNSNGNYCCNGTGLESFSKFGDSVYFTDGEGIFVNQFIATTVDWSERGVSLAQRTAFPEGESSVLTVGARAPVTFPLHVRVPAWCTSGFAVRVNGVPQAVDAVPASYVTLTRQWRDGDRIDVAIPMTVTTVSMADDPGVVAFKYGPLVLAGVGRDGVSPGGVLAVDGGDGRAWARGDAAPLLPAAGDPLAFRGTDAVGRQIYFRPYYKVVDEAYTINWRLRPYVGGDLARGGGVWASSAAGAPYEPGAAVDGNSGTRWAASGVAKPQWLTVDLGAAARVRACETLFERPEDAVTYQIATSLDGASWVPFADRSAEEGAGDPSYFDRGDVVARYVRLTVTGTQRSEDWASVRELSVYGRRLQGAGVSDDARR